MGDFKINKEKKLIILTVFLAIVLFLPFALSRMSGKVLTQCFQAINVEEIFVEKKLENAERIINEGYIKLTSDSITAFFDHLSRTKLINIYRSPFNINTDVRYIVTIKDKEGLEVGRLKFYGDEFLIFDCFYKDQPAVHKRCKITSTTLVEFFEAILP
ncbi:MAG: hypothetical protein MSC43_02195 [Clostridiales bacterium]|nr:hypothetical protein [Clostridiales bacterium]MDD7432111.1 hypothetical protein [Clostridiales bacterium]MDY3061096.1 hypothetical protein [Eubacteriales bacterium]